MSTVREWPRAASLMHAGMAVWGKTTLKPPAPPFFLKNRPAFCLHFLLHSLSSSADAAIIWHMCNAMEICFCDNNKKKKRNGAFQTASKLHIHCAVLRHQSQHLIFSTSPIKCDLCPVTYHLWDLSLRQECSCKLKYEKHNKTPAIRQITACGLETLHTLSHF